MQQTKIKTRLYRKRDILQMFLFLSICFYLSNCATTNRQHKTHQVKKSTSTSESRLRADIVRYAKKFVGFKYQYAGRGPKKFDCSGFTHYVMKSFDIDLTPVSRSQENQGKSITQAAARPGDLVFFRKQKRGNVYHVGLVVENDKNGIAMIHSSSSRGVVIDRINENSYWRTKIMTVRDVINY